MIKVIPYSAIKPFAVLAAKEGVSATDTTETVWFEGPSGAGFAGVIKISEKTKAWRIKGVFVFRHLRGKGIGDSMTRGIIEYARGTLKAKRIEALAYNPAYYERIGFKKITAIRGGKVWRVAMDF